jgi:hypothetical protein
MKDRRRIGALDIGVRRVAPHARLVGPITVAVRRIRHRLHDAGRMAHQALIAPREIVLYGRRFRCLLNRSEPHNEKGSNGHTHSEIAHNFPLRVDE